MPKTELNFPYAKMLAVMRLVAAGACTCGALKDLPARYAQEVLGQLEAEEPEAPTKRGLRVSRPH